MAKQTIKPQLIRISETWRIMFQLGPKQPQLFAVNNQIQYLRSLEKDYFFRSHGYSKPHAFYFEVKSGPAPFMIADICTLELAKFICAELRSLGCKPIQLMTHKVFKSLSFDSRTECYCDPNNVIKLDENYFVF